MPISSVPQQLSNITEFLHHYPGSVLLIATLVFLDWGFRLIAYKKLDAISVDMCIFSTIHGFFWMIVKLPECNFDYLFRFFVALGLTILGILLHRSLTDTTEKHIRNNFEKIKRNDNRIDMIWRLHDIASKLIEPDLLSIKAHKREARESLTNLIRELHFYLYDDFSENSFVLNREERFWWTLKLHIIGTLAVFSSTALSYNLNQIIQNLTSDIYAKYFSLAYLLLFIGSLGFNAIRIFKSERWSRWTLFPGIVVLFVIWYFIATIFL